MANHKDLVAWQRAMDLAEAAFATTRPFPQKYRRSLGEQIEKTAVSIPSNIGEGAGRATAADFARFLSYAAGSLAELDTQVCLARRLKLAEASPELDDLIDHVGRLLTALGKSIEKH